MSIVFRKIIESDKEEVFTMMRGFYSSDAIITNAPDEVLMRNINESLKNNNALICYVILSEGNIIGYSMVTNCFSTEYGGYCIWIEDLFLKENYRHKGIAKEFFRFIEREFKNTAIKYNLEVEANNKLAIAAYEKYGFKKSNYLTMIKLV